MKSSKGFTLIEILIVIAIVSVVSVMIGLFTLDVSDFGVFLGDTLTAQQELQQTMNVMLVEMRSVGPGDNGAYPIESVAANSLIFFSDINDDDSFERVRYFVDGTDFKKGITKASGDPVAYDTSNEVVRTLVKDVLSTTGIDVFSFYDTNYFGSGPALILPFPVSVVRMIKVDLTVDRTPLDQKGEVEYSVTAKLRNIHN